MLEAWNVFLWEWFSLGVLRVCGILLEVIKKTGYRWGRNLEASSNHKVGCFLWPHRRLQEDSQLLPKLPVTTAGKLETPVGWSRLSGLLCPFSRVLAWAPHSPARRVSFITWAGWVHGSWSKQRMMGWRRPRVLTHRCKRLRQAGQGPEAPAPELFVVFVLSPARRWTLVGRAVRELNELNHIKDPKGRRLSANASYHWKHSLLENSKVHRTGLVVLASWALCEPKEWQPPSPHRMN